MIDQIKKTFDEYLNLNYVKSRNDPEEEPFKTKYEARKLLENLILKLDTNLENSNTSQFASSASSIHANSSYSFFCNKLDPLVKLNFEMTAKSYLVSRFLQFNLAKNFIETEEVETGEKLVEKIIAELVKFESDECSYNPLLFSLKLSCFNELIFVWSHRADYKKSLSLLLQIDLIYEIYKNESSKSFLSLQQSPQMTTTMPFELNELILMNKEIDEEKRRKSFEALYTHSLFFFAQVYGKLDEKEKSAYYCRLTLQRQLDQYNEKLNEKELESNRESSDFQNEKVIFDPLDWATHAGAISQYYICLEDFSTARHCLCCAESVMETLQQKGMCEN